MSGRNLFKLPAILFLLTTVGTQISHATPVESLSVNFGNVRVNTRTELSYIITNDQTVPWKMTAFNIGGAGYDAQTDCDQLLAPKQKCRVDISFWPLMQGFQTGELILRFDKSEVDFDLAGWGSNF